MKIVESATFQKWITKLKDNRARARITARIHRLTEGLPGDVTPIGRGLSELRIHYGPGYRVYYYQKDDVLIILLCGGDKRTQQKDIKTAHAVLTEWRKQNG